MVRILISLVVMFVCDIGAMKKDRLSAADSKPSLRSSASDLIPANQSKNVSSRRILGRTGSVDSENTSSGDTGPKLTLSDSRRKFSRSDDMTTSSSTSSHTSIPSIPSSQIVPSQMPPRSSSKSPRELKASLVESSKNIKNLFDSDDKSQKIGYQLCTAIKKNKCLSINGILNAVDEEGRTPLIIAIKEECNDMVLELLGCAGVDVNKSDKSGRTPLISAIQKLIHFKPSSIKVLQESGDADKIALTINDTTFTLIQRLLSQESIDINKADNRKNTPLHHAVLMHNPTMIKLLLCDHRVNSELRNSDNRLAVQLIDDRQYQDISEIKVIFFGRSSLNKASDTEILALKMISANENNHDEISKSIVYIKKCIENDYEKQKEDRELPAMEPLFLNDEFIKKMIIYHLQENKPVNELEKVVIVINNSDAI